MNVKVKISALLLCAALLFDTVGATAATGFEDKRLEVMAGMTAGVSAGFRFILIRKQQGLP